MLQYRNRDAANAVANILVNNGYDAKIVYSKQVKGTPHAYVVTKADDSGSYIFDYDDIYEVSGTDNFVETAGTYSRSLMLMDPQTHRVTDIVVTPDGEYLDSIAGIR